MDTVRRFRCASIARVLGFAASIACALLLASAAARAEGEFLGRLGGSRYSHESTANPYGAYGSRYSPQSIHNPYGRYGSRYSPEGVANPYTSGGPKLYAEDGTYLGRLNSNRYDPESVSNPYGKYGSPHSPTSIHNPFSRYGSPFSPQSPNNPYTTRSPRVVGE